MPKNRSHRKHVRRFFFWARLVALLALMGFALRLFHWNRETDPRFFLFLRTSPGKALSRVMHWPNFYQQLRPERPQEDYTEEERIWHQKITASLKDTWPTHTLEFQDGSQRHLRILATTPTRLQVTEAFGSRGRLESFVSRDRIRELRPYTVPIPTVTWRDVRFQMAYPKFDLNYAGHYTILTDAPYYQVAASVEALEHLREQFLETFGSLIRYPKADESLQLLFFTRETEFRAHQEATAPDLINSVGYYSPLEDRMVLFNHEYSDHAEKVRAHVKEEVGFLVQQAESPTERNRLRLLQLRLEDQLRDQASMETLATLRHEGAHHLAYTYGVHSWIHTENAWLVEGLAAYFESPTPGGTVPGYVRLLRKMEEEGRIPDLARLVAVRLPEAFGSELPDIRPYEAYALSWSLFRLCMRPATREMFFNYLRTLQNPDDIPGLMKQPRLEMLADALALSPAELESVWRSSWTR